MKMYTRSIAIFVLGSCILGACAADAGHGRKLKGCLDPTGFFCSNESTCPPQGFDAVQDLDVDKYVSAPWYIQEQMVNTYQPASQLYCVRASYKLLNPDDKSEGLVVNNYANDGKVNGPPMGITNPDGGFFSSFSQLRAIIPDASRPSKLAVGPAFFDELFGKAAARALYGPYWIVATGPSADDSLGYDWAIVSGGPPKVETDGGCRTGSEFLQRFRVNGVGLWLFSRKPVDPANTQIMRAKAESLGFDLSVLLPVAQEGCEYNGAR